MNIDSFATSKAGLADSQDTSKAGLSFNSQTSIGSTQLKLIVPDEFAPDETSDCSADSSPRRHKATAQNRPPASCSTTSRTSDSRNLLLLSSGSSSFARNEEVLG